MVMLINVNHWLITLWHNILSNNVAQFSDKFTEWKNIDVEFCRRLPASVSFIHFPSLSFILCNEFPFQLSILVMKYVHTRFYKSRCMVFLWTRFHWSRTLIETMNNEANCLYSLKMINSLDFQCLFCTSYSPYFINMGCFSLLHGDVSLQQNIWMDKLISLYFPDLRARASLILIITWNIDHWS